MGLLNPARKILTQNASVESLVNKVNTLFLGYLNYVDNTQHDDYKKTHEEVVRLLRDEKYSTIKQLIQGVKKAYSSVKDSDEFYKRVLPPLIAQYIIDEYGADLLFGKQNNETINLIDELTERIKRKSHYKISKKGSEGIGYELSSLDREVITRLGKKDYFKFCKIKRKLESDPVLK